MVVSPSSLKVCQCKLEDHVMGTTLHGDCTDCTEAISELKSNIYVPNPWWKEAVETEVNSEGLDHKLPV